MAKGGLLHQVRSYTHGLDGEAGELACMDCLAVHTTYNFPHFAYMGRTHLCRPYLAVAAATNTRNLSALEDPEEPAWGALVA